MQSISAGFSAVTFNVALASFLKGLKLEVFTYGNRPPVIVISTENCLLSPSAKSLFLLPLVFFGFFLFF